MGVKYGFSHFGMNSYIMLKIILGVREEEEEDGIN